MPRICTRRVTGLPHKVEEVNALRFYVTGPGETCELAIEFEDAEAALSQAADAALAIARDNLASSAENTTLHVYSEEGLVGSVTVKVLVRRS
jgi:hypothetical protein